MILLFPTSKTFASIAAVVPYRTAGSEKHERRRVRSRPNAKEEKGQNTTTTSTFVDPRIKT